MQAIDGVDGSELIGTPPFRCRRRQGARGRSPHSIFTKAEVRLSGFSTRAIHLNCHFFRIPAKGRPVTEEGVERKLTTILAADVVGYSRLMERAHSPSVRPLARGEDALPSGRFAQSHC